MNAAHQQLEDYVHDPLRVHGYPPVLGPVVNHEQLNFSCMVGQYENNQDECGERDCTFQYVRKYCGLP